MEELRLRGQALREVTGDQRYPGSVLLCRLAPTVTTRRQDFPYWVAPPKSSVRCDEWADHTLGAAP
ncbi:hypothetical protein OG840_17945 [Streptomyces sp. NBC_01764]|uniref:hypothetical protein n=1 Tax=Streptomyces sp. NBC_01764 TaxID=2975935 RepID=UPI002251DAAB|nr:hypothetical protein [Streptomyces sp. NBC_01764]MCX4403628.1 hypothetical protein [Streptomyces sp. NBC_01764]